MRKTPYYSLRTGKNPNAAKLDLPLLKRLFLSSYTSFFERDYFQEAFGFVCVDSGDVPGTLGKDIPARFVRSLRKDNLWPIPDKINDYSEDDLFDIIEFLYDLISKPVDGEYHSYNQCGYHYTTFDKQSGREEFIGEINPLLMDYQEGFELSEQGEILARIDSGFEPLLQADVPHADKENIEQRVNAAILKFRRYRSSMDDRKDAIRDLADVLEFLRPRIKSILTNKDESDLFNIANNFGIRHHNTDQKKDYDKPIWYSWIFYYSLATIHAWLRLLQKSEERKTTTETIPQDHS